MPIGERISFAVKVFIAEFPCQSLSHTHTHRGAYAHKQVNETIKGENGRASEGKRKNWKCGRKKGRMCDLMC